MSACLSNKMQVEDYEIAPNFKRMKLSSESQSNIPDYEVDREGLKEKSLQKEMKFVFPYLSEEKIKEILMKSDNNSEVAKKMIHDINEVEAKKNKDFVNLHSVNRKRRFDEINTVVPNFVNISNIGLVKNNVNKNLPIFNKSATQSITNNCSEEEINKILDDVSHLFSKEEIKDYLMKTINNMIKEKIRKIQPSQHLQENNQPQINPQEIKKINEDLIADNESLKKGLVNLYRRCEADKELKQENQVLSNKLEQLEYKLKLERSKNENLSIMIRQMEMSNRLDYDDQDNIY